jgi:hypothetical protein
MHAAFEEENGNWMLWGAAAAGVGDGFKPLFDRQRGLVSLPFSIDIHILEISDHRMLSYSFPTAYGGVWQYCHLYQPPISSFVPKSLVLGFTCGRTRSPVDLFVNR